MLTAVAESTNSRVEADTADGGLTFRCQSCGGRVGLKRGAIRVAHFAHLDKRECPENDGETDAHRKAKLAIYHGLKRDPRAANVALEHYLGISRPDVYFEFGGVRWAIEVQRSHLTPHTITERTGRYAKMGVAVLWVFTEYPDKLRAWQQVIHRASFSRCYVWAEGAVVTPVHYFHDEWSLPGIPVPICGGFKVTTYSAPVEVRVARKNVTMPVSMWAVDRQPTWWVTRARLGDPASKAQAGADMTRARDLLHQRRLSRPK